jgi:glycosyltransferase involved in cell wall biosynthesis
MTALHYTFIIPVFNRPDEVADLLESLSHLEGDHLFEVVVIEDGSVDTCESVCVRFRGSLTIHYLFKDNSGPGDSRNYGMSTAIGDYFVILDSDCVIPPGYLNAVSEGLRLNYVDCYGGPDAAQHNFSSLQKAINYSMTSLLTTGGIRGGSENLGKFQPRSFNMGLSRAAFKSSGGFGNIHPGEDPDLTIRLWELGYQTRLFEKAFVYHKRRISFRLFYKQVNKFGMVRVILNKWHPQTAKITYWFPSFFLLSIISGLLLMVAGRFWLLALIAFYLIVIGVHSSLLNGIRVGGLSVVAVFIQFIGYGWGFLYSNMVINLLKRDEHKALKQLFFMKS